MRILTAAIVLGPLLLGGLPAAAQPASPDNAPVPAASSDSAADRSAYLQKAQDQMQEWGRKLHEFGADTAAKGRQGSAVAEQDLNTAWTETKAASLKLGDASTQEWVRAKIGYEEASRLLADAWHKIHPDEN